jgi:hypothetical protein
LEISEVVVEQRKVPWMRIEKRDLIVALHSARPLELAVETATVHLIDWLVSEYGFSATDAYCLVSTCPHFRINVYQMCKIGIRRRGRGGRKTRAKSSLLSLPCRLPGAAAESRREPRTRVRACHALGGCHPTTDTGPGTLYDGIRRRQARLPSWYAERGVR